MAHKLKAFPEASRRLLQGNNAMERVHFCMTMKNQFHHRFRVLKSPRCGSAPWWQEGLPARIQSECTVNKTHPGWGRSKVLGNVPKPGRIKIYSNWHTEVFNNLEICLPVNRTYTHLPVPSLHQANRRCWLQAQGPPR